MANSAKIKFGREEVIFDTGTLAKQANGAIRVTYGGTVVLVTACMSAEAREGQGFFPLTVEYQEKTYAAGRIPGGFFKREGKPSESEILTARLIDRPIRPLFPKGFLNDVQIVSLVLSSDGENDPDIFAVNAAALALMISDIPFKGPLACCRVSRDAQGFILNPTYAQLDASDLDVVVASTPEGVVMMEGKCKEVSEEVYWEAVKFGVENLKAILDSQQAFAQKAGKSKAKIEFKKIDPQLIEKVRAMSVKRLQEIYRLGSKEEREDGVHALSKELEASLESEGYESGDVRTALVDVEEAEVNRKILEESTRVDGRKFDEIRPITCDVSVLPRTHGSAVFTRGQTQSLAVTTLGTGEDEQLIEALEGEKYKTFMLHYSFPPFSVGETAPMRGPGRREIGHGALAEKAIFPIMPSKEKFPYTVRVVSEILESNGSSSMATVCASSLSLMDAGVPISAPVSGIALGLVRGKDRNIILSDIAGVEDHFGEMDFKVAGTRNGITAAQMDVKGPGLDSGLLKECLEQAKQGRMFILDKMTAALKGPREKLSIYAPRIDSFKINTEKIGAVIGPGGKTIKQIIAATGATIDIEDDGTVLVASTDAAKSQAAINMIKAITEDVEVGRIYRAKVKRITNFGAFCEIAPGKEGLVHVSELSDKYVKEVTEVVKLGDEISVKVVNIDELGRINLSKKKAEQSGQSEKEANQ